MLLKSLETIKFERNEIKAALLQRLEAYDFGEKQEAAKEVILRNRFWRL